MRCPVCHRRLSPGAPCDTHPAHVAPAATEAGFDARAASAAVGMPVLRVVGRGGFATVYLGRLPDPAAEPVAIKLAHDARDPRLEREAAVLRRVGPPTTPALIAEEHASDGRPMLVMEYVEGVSLAEILALRERAWCADLDAVSALLVPLCEAVQRLHDAGGCAHRDLKPEHIICRRYGGVALVDLGLAGLAGRGLAGLGFAETMPAGGARVDTAHAETVAAARVRFPDTADGDGADAVRLTATGQRMGTHHYMAPEQWQDAHRADRRADVYALGVILFELLAGRPPFVGDPAAIRHGHVSGRCPRVADAIPGAAGAIPAQIESVVQRCLAKHPADRYARAIEVAAAFQLAVTDAGGDERDSHASAGGAARRETARRETARARELALLSIATRAPIPAVTRYLAGSEATLARIEGERYVVAFPWLPPARGVRAALAMARTLAAAVETCGASVVHCAPLRVRVRGQRVRLVGPAVLDVASWTPGDDRRGVLATAAAARFLESWVVAPAAEGFAAVSDALADSDASDIDPRAVPLRGREALIRDVVGAMRDTERPILVTLEAASGLGRTRVLDAIADRLAAGTTARVIRLQAADTADPNALPRALCNAALAHLDDAGASLPALDDAEREALAILGEGAAETAPYRLELAASSRGALKDAPGALRNTTARAISRLLSAAARQAAIVIAADDVHRASPVTLDILEQVTLAGADADAAIAVCVAAGPSLRALRPHWSTRAADSRHLALDPLDREAAHALLCDVLQPRDPPTHARDDGGDDGEPVIRVPRPVLDRIYELTGGVPLYLVELGRMVRRSGAIRRHHGTTGYYVAADTLLRVTDQPIDERLAQRALAGVPGPFVPVAELAAVVCGPSGDAFAVGEVIGVQASFRALFGEPLIDVDPSVGLSRLVALDVLERRGDGFAVRLPMVRSALEAAISPDRLHRLHAAVFDHGQRAGMARERLARHAARGGHGEAAVSLLLGLADQALARHRYVEAERHASAAIELSASRTRERAHALEARGQARYRLHRYADALADLELAGAAAEARGDEAAAVELLLVQAAVLDWGYDARGAEAIVADAVVRARALGVPRLLAAADLAEGRELYRHERLDEAIAALERAVARAAALGQYETRVVGLILLAPALAYRERFDDAAARFDEVIALCRRAGDDFHLAVAHINRQVLWMKRNRVDRAMADLEVCVAVGRRLGNAELEHPATFNLAELLYLTGETERALALARRSQEMQRELVSAEPFHDALLLARLAWRDDPGEAAAHVRRLEAERASLPPSARTLLAMVELALSEQAAAARTAAATRDARAAWHALADEAATTAVLEEHGEVLATAAELYTRIGARDEAAYWLDHLREVGGGSRIWTSRIASLQAALSELDELDDRAAAGGHGAGEPA